MEKGLNVETITLKFSKSLVVVKVDDVHYIYSNGMDLIKSIKDLGNFILQNITKFITRGDITQVISPDWFLTYHMIFVLYKICYYWS